MFLLIFSAAAFAGPLEPEAVSSSEAIPLYVPEDIHGCSLQVNPAMLRSESARQHWLRASSEANARVRGLLLDQTKRDAQGDGTGASGVSPPHASSGPPVLRYDAAGNVILRLGFLVSPKALMRYGQARLERDSAKAVVSVNQHFSDSGVGVVFEWAGVETYTGTLDETNLVLSELHSQVASPSRDYPGFVPGNYEALLAYRTAHQVNLAVLLALPVIPNSSGVADRGRYNFQYSSFLVALDSASSESVTTVYPEVLTHEIGHAMGLRHGVSQDLAPLGLDTDPAQVLAYRMSTNYPYASGVVNTDASGAGVYSMMALGWYATPTVFPKSTPVFVRRFSDPSAVVKVSTVTGAVRSFALGFVDKEDSVRALKLDRLSFATASTPLLVAWTVPVVEYYHAGLNQYFMTAKPEQIALLDRLAESKTGWKRTGESFIATSAEGDAHPLAPNDVVFELRPVLRFYGDPSGPNTHFYTALTIGRSGWTVDRVNRTTTDNYSDEDVLRKLEIANAGNPHTLHFEGMDFRVDAYGNPDGSPTQPGTFRCTDQYFDYWHPTEKPWAPVYRVFNGENGTKLRADGSPIDGNHRYTTKRTIVESMVKQGWIDEGIAWCERTFEQIR